MQDVETIKPGYPLFNTDEYQESFARKRVFEEAPPKEKLEEVFQWTTTEAYKELNFQRQALTINPAKACQPLGAVLCALGFYKTLPYVHGSQGCVAYFRTYFNRHFREPIAAVSDSMTEDAAVFGGQKNMFEGLENSKAMYQPEMIAVSTTCNERQERGPGADGFPHPVRPYPQFRRQSYHWLGQYAGRHSPLFHGQHDGR